MATKPRIELYEIFSTGNKPTQDDFVDLIDSAINIAEDGIGASEPGKPIEFVAQGTRSRYLDLSSDRDTPVWRFNARSFDSARNGLNISSYQTSRLFIVENSGHIGFNNDNPKAQLHITAELSESGLLVDNPDGDSYLKLDSDGKVIIGKAPAAGNPPVDQEKLAVEGRSTLNGQVEIGGELTVSSGITANGATIKANKGVTVFEGATIQTGTLAVASGADLSVSGTMTVTNGADVSGGTLNVAAAATLNVDGSFSAKNGATISGADLAVSNSATISGSLSVSKGVAINDGELTVSQGGNIDGRLKLNGGATVSGSELNVTQGATFDGSSTVNGVAATFTGGEIRSIGGIIVNSGELVAKGDVTFSGANGITVSAGGLKAESGATISGGKLIAMDGATVNGANGLTVADGEFEAQNGATISGTQGVTVDGGELKAQNGAIISGSSGAIISGGLLEARNGAAISGDPLLAQSGAIISGAVCQIENGALVKSNLNAPDIVDLGSTTVDSLNVKGALTAKNIEFDSVDLKTLNAENANIKNLATEGGLTIDSEFAANNNVLLGNEKLIINYEGPSNETAIVNIVSGSVGNNPGHFSIAVVGATITITYDEQSKIENLIDDWNTYKRDNVSLSRGFFFFRVGNNPWKPQTVTEILRSTQIPIKQYRISRNGVRTIYSGTELTSPIIKIEANSDLVDENYDFALIGSTLTVKYPNVIAYRTAGYQNMRHRNLCLISR